MSKYTETAVKLLESLPEELQRHVVEELNALVEDVRDEVCREHLFSQDSTLRRVGSGLTFLHSTIMSHPE